MQHPDKLFRRVRDKHGDLRLSKSANDFGITKNVFISSEYKWSVEIEHIEQDQKIHNVI